MPQIDMPTANSIPTYPQPHVLEEQMKGIVEGASRHIEHLREELANAEATRTAAQAALEQLNMAQPKQMDTTPGSSGVARY